MIEIRQTEEFKTWLHSLRDGTAKVLIAQRIRRMQNGNPGHIKRLTSGVSEMKIDHGPGYRVYFTQRGPVVTVLLCGGDKSTQSRDVKHAIALSSEIGD